MYSKKLRQLVKNKTPLKFRLSSQQQSKELQEFLFALGFYWSGETVGIVEKTEMPFLTLSGKGQSRGDDYSIRFCYLDQSDYFSNREIKEFDLENDCLVDSKEEIIKITWEDLEGLLDIKFECFKKSIKDNI